MTIPDIRALVAERQRFDDWLNALALRRAETPARVFDRVHADYVARRDAVIEGLHAHVGSLESLEQDLNDRLQHVELQLAEREDAHAEGILRTAVGEFDNERWEAARQDVEASIAQLGNDRQALNAERDDVRSLLASARPKKVEPEPAPEPVTEPEPEPLVVANVTDVEAEFVSSNVASAIAHADPAVVEHTIDLNADGEFGPVAAVPAAVADDLNATDPYLRAVRRNAEAAADIESAFAVSDDSLELLTETQHVTPPAMGLPFPQADRTAPLDLDADSEADAAIDAFGRPAEVRLPAALDDIDVFGESTPSAPAGSASVAPKSNSDPYAPRSHSAETPRNASTPGAAPTRDAFDDLAFLRSITESGNTSSASPPRTNGVADQTKTLRCTECGTMNFPTEWYCERCGGELATF